MIKQEGGKWVLHISDGRKESFDSEEAAKKREEQVKMFKHVGESKDFKDCAIDIVTDLREARVDRDARVIRGVSILSRHSRDARGSIRRTYSDTALRSVLEAMEGAPAYIDHGDPKKERSFHDAYGFYRGGSILNEGTDTARAVKDLFLLDCEDGKKVLSMAEMNPELAGNSIHAGGRCRIQSGIECVEQVLPRTMWGHKSSVDLVIDPATTSSLIEKKSAVKENGMELKDLNLAEMKAGRPDLAAQLLKEGSESKAAEITALTEERNTLKAKLDEYAVKEAVARKAGMIDTLLAEAKLPAELVTSLFKQTLMNLSERKEGEKSITVEQQAKELIEERRAFIGGVKNNGGKSNGGGNGKSEKDYVAAIKG